jgi:hypothetical protein
VSDRCGVCEIVSGYEFDFRIVQSGPNYVTADAAETVDPNFDGHSILLTKLVEGILLLV